MPAPRARARQQSHGIEVEPYGFFVAKCALLFGVSIYFTYLIASHRGLPNVLVIMVALIALYDFVTTRMAVGRHIYALGGNAKAARLSGIKTERLTFLTFVNMGVLAALAGLVFAARLNTATPEGRARFRAGRHRRLLHRRRVGLGRRRQGRRRRHRRVVMGVMNNGMSILGIGIDYQQVIKGLVLLAAVCVDVYNQRR